MVSTRPARPPSITVNGAPAPLMSAPAAGKSRSAAKPAAAKPAAAKPAAPAKPDDLQLIKGIGPVNDRKLRQHGITTFAQIAAWKKADIVAVEKYLEFDGRIAREDWIGQAKKLGKLYRDVEAEAFKACGVMKKQPPAAPR